MAQTSAKKAIPAKKAVAAKAGSKPAPAKVVAKTAPKSNKPGSKPETAKAAGKPVAAKVPPGKAMPAKAPAAKTAAKEKPSPKPAAVIGNKPAQGVASKPIPGGIPASASKETIKVSSKTERNRMTPDELKYFETLLNEKKETLLQELGYLEDNTMRLNSKEGAGDLSSHAYHLADHATETMDREQAFQLASREGKYLYHIEEALDRVRAGTFGVCKSCGKLIVKARLEAVPTAKMCISCKSSQEQHID